MKVFLTGATGVAGRITVPALLAAGHDVRAVSRRPEASAVLEAAGAEPVTVDLFDADAVDDAVGGSEAIVYLATNVPEISRAARPKGWEQHNRLRVDATRNLVAAARATGAARFVKESITFVYADGGDRWLDESAPLIPDLGQLAPTIEGEDLALEFGADGTAVVLRFGLFYGGAGNRGTDENLRLARFRRSLIAGDVASAVVAALTVPSGIYNVADDEPLTRVAYLAAFATAFDVKPPKPTPARLMKLFGGAGAEGLLASQRVCNRKFRDASGWSPAYADARVGWAAVAAARGEG